MAICRDTFLVQKRQQQAAAEAALERRLAHQQDGEEGRGEGDWAERVHHVRLAAP
jgi:hypothetical protein